MINCEASWIIVALIPLDFPRYLAGIHQPSGPDQFADLGQVADPDVVPI